MAAYMSSALTSHQAAHDDVVKASIMHPHMVRCCKCTTST